VRRILLEPRFRTEARRVQKLYAGIDGASEAAAHIVRYLRSRRAAGSGSEAFQFAAVA